MAYAIHELPAAAQMRITEYRQHFLDVEQLRAANGTPSARAVKAFRVSAVKGDIVVRALVRHRDYIRRHGHWRCQWCRFPHAEGSCSCRARCVRMSTVSFKVTTACSYLP